MQRNLITPGLVTALGVATLTGCQSAPSSGVDDHARIIALAESGAPAVHLWISGFA